jgi:hypothetical protein
MTRKHFEAIAQHVRECRMLGLFVDSNAADIFTRELAHALEKTNPLFDGEKFQQACGMGATEVLFIDVTDEHLDDRETFADCD